jgi:hypothetical protein
LKEVSGGGSCGGEGRGLAPVLHMMAPPEDGGRLQKCLVAGSACARDALSIDRSPTVEEDISRRLLSSADWWAVRATSTF